jgi:regulatory protein
VKKKPIPKAPDAGLLHEAALRHLARYAVTEAGLAQVLRRRVDRWARAAEDDPERVEAVAGAAREAIAGIVARLAASGAVSDAAFAATRVRSLARAGRSRRAIGAHLANKGVPGELAAGALGEDAAGEDAHGEEGAGELAAALIHARKRRMGAWRRKEASPEVTRRELASLARAGFAHGVARRALRMDLDEAEGLIVAFRAEL